MRAGVHSVANLLACAALALVVAQAAGAAGTAMPPLLLTADRLFDGSRMLTNAAVLVESGRIAAVGSRASVAAPQAQRIDLGDATILPGFVDLHVHYVDKAFLESGLTTVRLMSEPLAALQPPTAAPGALRVVAAGPFVVAPNGFSIGGRYVVRSRAQARRAVRVLVERGARFISLVLYSRYPMLSLAQTRAIVSAAHALHVPVVAHAQQRGIARAIAAHVDELAEWPCNATANQLRLLVRRHVPIVSGTLRTDDCVRFDHENPARGVRTFVRAGGRLLYGTELLPPSLSAEQRGFVEPRELEAMVRDGLTPLQALAAATSEAGAELRLSPLGTLTVGAPADLWAVPGDPAADLELLRRPLVVVAGGVVVKPAA